MALPDKFFSDFPKNELLILNKAAFSNTVPLTVSPVITTNDQIPLAPFTITYSTTSISAPGPTTYFFQNVDGKLTPPWEDFALKPGGSFQHGVVPECEIKPPKALHSRLILCEKSENFHIIKLTTKHKINTSKTICGIPSSGKRKLSENDAITVFKHFVELWCQDCRKAAEKEYKHVLEQ